MTESITAEKREQNVNLHNRQKLEMTGVCDVLSFTDTDMEMLLDDGNVAVDGEGLRIESFSAQTGKLYISGKVDAITYFGKEPSKAKNKKKRG